MLRPVALAPPIVAIAVAALTLAGLLSAPWDHAAKRPAEAARLAAETSISIADCTKVDSGDTFDIEIAVNGISNLAAWEVYFAYDRKILEVTGRDVRVFLAQKPNSNVFDFSDPVPNTDGIYRLAAADLAAGGATESGSGVLARVTLKALAKGVSPASVFRWDVNSDGAPDFGPTLTGTGGKHIGDTNGDAIFDGAISSGQVAVGRSCAEPPPTPAVEDVIAILPSVSVGVSPGSGQTPSPGAPGGETPAPPLETGAPSPSPQQQDTGTPFVSGDAPGDSPGGGGGDGGPAAWLIGSIAAAALMALAGLFLIIRSARRAA